MNPQPAPFPAYSARAGALRDTGEPFAVSKSDDHQQRSPAAVGGQFFSGGVFDPWFSDQLRTLAIISIKTREDLDKIMSTLRAQFPDWRTQRKILDACFYGIVAKLDKGAAVA